MSMHLFNSLKKKEFIKKKQQQIVEDLKQIEQNNQDFLQLNLNKWKLLAHGGAFWIFYIPKQMFNLYSQINKTSQTFTEKTYKHNENQKNLSKQKRKLKQTNKYQQNGDYVMRLRQIKWIQKLIDLRINIILQLLKRSQLNTETISKNTSNQLKNEQDSFSKLQNLENLLLKEQKKLSEFHIKGSDALTILLRKIYDQFLGNTLNLSKQLFHENDFHKVNESQLLPKISSALVRQSQSYYIDNFNNQEIDDFIYFLFRELIFQKLELRIIKQKLRPITNDEIAQKVSLNLKTYPIHYELLRPLFVKQQVCITFQRNLLDFNISNERNQNDKNVQQFSEHKNNFYQVHIGQVFELKPKTILPDIYTQQFIDDFVQRYRNHQSLIQLVKIKQNTTISQNNGSQSFDYDQKSQKLSDNSSRQSQISIQQKIKQAIIEQIQQTIDKNEPQKLQIQSTRWFKKNCLQKGKKKKNQNPMQYFNNCLLKNNHFKRQTINYYDKKHLRRVQILKTVDKINMVENKEVFKTNHQNKNYELQYKNGYHSNKRSQSLQDQITKYINSKQFVQTQHTIRICQQKKQKVSNLSLIQEILALQLIDLTDVFSQDNKVNFLNGQNFIGIMEVQKISHLLKNLALNNETISFPKFNKNKQLNKSTSHSKSLQFINNAFHRQVYSKALKLAQQLKNIIFQSPQVNYLIQKTFNLSQLQIGTEKLQIKIGLFYLMRYLISLTWKDISLLVQQQMVLTFNHSKFQQFSLELNLNQIEVQKQIIELLISKSTQIQRKVLNCNIIDYNLKTLQNIDKNVQKDHEFLLNFLKFKVENKN